jgi:hypothetical protein
MQLRENTIFAKRYQLVRILGYGGFAEVWLAEDTVTGLSVAIKAYAPMGGMDEDGLKMFAKELASVYNINHMNLLKPQHVDSWEGRPYMVMPYCSNGSLEKKIGKCREEDIWEIIHEVGAGLSYLHENDVVLQDIKPDNILIDDAGHYLITDFGISTSVRNTLQRATQRMANSGSGSMAYMGPERFSKQPAPTKASDIWSFGAMLYELLEGSTPYREMGGALQKGGAEIPEITANVSDKLKNTIYKMLSKEPWDRPTASQLASMSPTGGSKLPMPKQHLWGQILHGWHTGVYALLSLIGFIGIWSNRHMFPDYMGALHYFTCILELYFITAFIANILICLHKKYGYVLYQISTFIMYATAWLAAHFASIMKSYYSGDDGFIYMIALIFSIPVLGSSISLYAHYQGTPFYKVLGITDMKKYNTYLIINIGFILGFVLLFFFSPVPD